ncbi:hypothetical protein M0R89_09245 [Halorussus limi]|uniref:Uncharacterized protein n=1 Tax=Halorussus limi TaxID=2938695 RepID=A0A8U0HPQ7_9EURY|nr:hypothetical protein [Halorussus limi]UPV72733.1 hypothetical protein M0R89_09245 [Halorussus limi]
MRKFQSPNCGDVMAQSDCNTAVVIDVDTDESTGQGVAEFKERLADELAEDYDYYIDDESPIYLAEDIISQTLVDTMELVCADITARTLLDWIKDRSEQEGETYIVNQFHQLRFTEIRIENQEDDRT